MKLREGRSATALGVLAAALLIAAPAAALEIHIGGIDRNSQYTGFETDPPELPPPADAGIFTFDDQFNQMNAPELGEVSSYDLPALNLDQGGTWAKVDFEAILGPVSRQGLNFNPATDSVAQAIFLSTPQPLNQPQADFTILDPIDNMTVALAFELNYIEVTQTGWAGAADPDGRIVLGDSTATATSSRLVLVGGSLNHLVGGIGVQARLEITLATLTPPILVRGDRRGYLNANFLSGVGATPVATTTWNLTIIPEPSTAALLGFSLLGVLAVARRRARR
jgi:hypothetical protein